MMPDPIRSDDQPHDEAEALLPWYATGQLDAADRAIVEKHLSSCARCQRQLTAERRLIDEFQAINPHVDSGWESLRARIAPAPAWRPWQPKAAADLRELLRRPAVGMLAAAQFAFLLVGAGLFLSISRPDYHALGSAPVAPAANVLVMFNPDATEAEMRGALKASGASLVGGPTPTNAYLVHVPTQARTSAVAKLQADRDVAMAQPIDGPSR